MSPRSHVVNFILHWSDLPRCCLVGQPLNKDKANLGAASTGWHGREGDWIPSLCAEISTALWLWGEHILNMDETPMRFELPATRKFEFTGNRTVPILSCGGDKQSFTVVLAVKASGEKLPLKVIFKGIRQLRIQVPPRMQVSVHKKGWMDEEGLFLFLTFAKYRHFS